MKTVFQLKAFAFLFCAFFISSVAFGQMDGAPQSPRDSVSGTVNGANIKIAFGAPSVRGRKIFGDGGLQPYGKNWRAGANQMTTFQTDKDIEIEGKKLPAGKYSLFANPGEKEWIITLNSVTGQWGIKRDGSANDDPAKDVLVVKVKPITLPDLVERMTFKITDSGFSLVWEHTEVPVRIK
jgi:hypothetical protein